MKIVEFDDAGRRLGEVDVEKIVRSEQQWREQLSPESFEVARRHGTELPFTGALNLNHADGVYRCVCCGTALFASETKFDSGTGWPSFFAPIANENVVEKTDSSLGMIRVEIQCARCCAHLRNRNNLKTAIFMLPRVALRRHLSPLSSGCANKSLPPPQHLAADCHLSFHGFQLPASPQRFAVCSARYSSRPPPRR